MSKKDFNIWKNHPDLCYLDNAATTQTPHQVLEKVARYYETHRSNVNRGVYFLGEQTTKEYSDSRQKVADFIGAKDNREVIFTYGTTDSINLIAQTWGEENIREHDEIVLCICNHHANIVPWQLLSQKKGASLRYIMLKEDGTIDLAQAKSLFTSKTKILALSHVSNVLGILHPVKELIELAHSYGAIAMIDGAQAVPHLSVDVKDLDCDFYVFSGHKMLAPTGIGILYGKLALLEKMPPYRGGGDMIRRVSLFSSDWNELPYKFEAGTPNISGAIGLGAAVDYLQVLPREENLKHERKIGKLLYDELKKNKKIRLFGNASTDWVGIVSFYHEEVHPHDLASIFDSEKICIRAGHHCAQPLMDFLHVPATSRVSPFFYNTEEDIDRVIRALRKAEKIFS